MYLGTLTSLVNGCLLLFIPQNIVIIPTDATCCPDINIEDVVLLNKIGEIAENTAYTQSFLVSDSKFSGFRV